MIRPEQPPLAEVKEEIGSLVADSRRMIALRWQLARLELRAAAGTIKRLSIGWLVCAVMALSGVPLLLAAAAEQLQGRLGIPFAGWLLIFGLVLLCGGAAGGYLAWRRFRRRFTGIEETLEELREDLVWLREWAGQEDESRPAGDG
jgi:protein-S-isoprenylcysteine O-methyltransferase Ste14